MSEILVIEGRVRGFPSAETLRAEEGHYGRAHARAEVLTERDDGSLFVDFGADISEAIVRYFDQGEDPMKWAEYRDLGTLRITIERLAREEER